MSYKKGARQLLPICVALSANGAALFASSAWAAEGYRMRALGMPVLGGEMASAQEHRGFFATAAWGYLDSYKIVDDNGDRVSAPGQTIPLPTGAATGGAIPDGTYSATLAPTQVEFQQQSQQLRFIVGYLFETGIEGGRLGFSLSKPYQRMDREVDADVSTLELTPQPPATMPPQLVAALDAVTARVAEQISARQQAALAINNKQASGFGDTTLGVFYAHASPDNRLRLGLDVTLSIPDGQYDNSRAVNPSFNYYTTRVETAAIYSFGSQGENSVFSGITVGNRTAYGWNTKNKDTNIKTGEFFTTEIAVEKVIGRLAVGLSTVAVIQTTDDFVGGSAIGGFNPEGRLRTYSAGPFVAVKFKKLNSGLNLSYADTFYARNAQVSQGVSLRLIKAW